MTAALDRFNNQPRWVNWREEPRDDDQTKLTKVPYQTDGRKASSTSPRTWSVRDEVKSAIPEIMNGHLHGGIGLVLGDIGNDVFLAGTDLDTCRHEDGMWEPWAQAVIDRFKTYTGLRGLLFHNTR
jgi:putative DNA primase/helicase